MMKNAINRYENSWQGWQSVVQTFDLDEDLDIEKIKALLNESEAEEEKK